MLSRAVTRGRRLRAIGFRTVLSILKVRFIYEVVLPAAERCGIQVLPSHYSSPAPDARQLRDTSAQWFRESNFPGIDFHLDDEERLLTEVTAYKPEYDHLPHRRVFEQGLGLGYPEVEASLLYAMVRHIKPRTIVEVGSGSSTLYSIRALSANRRETGVRSKMIAVEPDPRPTLTLTNMKGDCDVEIVPKVAQDLDIDFFKVLQRDDILFIDSSHVSKLGSDVDYLYLEVLPTLNPGVIVHIHDIPWPYPARDLDWVLKRRQYYTEPALVQALLINNDAFRILLSTSYLHHRAPKALRDAFAAYHTGQTVPTALWLRKET